MGFDRNQEMQLALVDDRVDEGMIFIYGIHFIALPKLRTEFILFEVVTK